MSILSGSWRRVLWAGGKWIAGIGILLVLMAHLAGVFTPGRIEAGWAPPAAAAPGAGATATAEVRPIPILYEAVGTVRSRQRFEVAAQASGRILEVAVREGDRVEQGALLGRIESDMLAARREQARQAREAAAAAERAAADLVSGAAARATRAEAERTRVRRLFEEKAATARQMEAADAEFLEAEAGVNAARARLAGAKAEVARADGQVREAEVALAYTRVVASHAGEVVRRHVEPGDLAWAGRPLVVLHDPRDLRLEAAVREGLVGRTAAGARVQVHVEALGLALDGRVDEVVPSADPRSRTFLVKVAIPYRDGLLVGMFGRLRLVLGERS
ncbi:MAG: efflux RND transporter periplasmic adaptor subunit, partial [Planctomycetes bacterium]|nr:efflux RND transporter periplasmic adaptor subunit [Planctomycetota bacterium]